MDRLYNKCCRRNANQHAVTNTRTPGNVGSPCLFIKLGMFATLSMDYNNYIKIRMPAI
jgi:hypothetical protein